MGLLKGATSSKHLQRVLPLDFCDLFIFIFQDFWLGVHIPWICICGNSWELGLKSFLQRFALWLPTTWGYYNTVPLHSKFHLVCFSPNKWCEFWYQIYIRTHLWLNSQREIETIFPRVKAEIRKHPYQSSLRIGIFPDDSLRVLFFLGLQLCITVSDLTST